MLGDPSGEPALETKTAPNGTTLIRRLLLTGRALAGSDDRLGNVFALDDRRADSCSAAVDHKGGSDPRLVCQNGKT